MRLNRTVATDPELLLARRACYRLAALALADPQADTWHSMADPATRELATAAAAILQNTDAAVARPLAPNERPLAELDPKQIFARLPTSAGELNDLYEANFGLLGGSKCPPYETEYVPGKFTFQRSNQMADIAGFYNAFGLRLSSSNPDRPDHVALECEFMAHVLFLQYRAGQSTDADAASRFEICQQAAERFLREHVVWWMPAFAKLLAHQDPGGYYEAVGRFLAAFIAAERALARIDSPKHHAEPSPIETADQCSGCELAIH